MDDRPVQAIPLRGQGRHRRGGLRVFRASDDDQPLRPAAGDRHRGRGYARRHSFQGKGDGSREPVSALHFHE